MSNIPKDEISWLVNNGGCLQATNELIIYAWLISIICTDFLLGHKIKIGTRIFNKLP